MKNILALFFVVFATVVSAQNNPAKTSFADAVDYNNYIIDQQTLIGTYFDEFAKTISDTTLSKYHVHTKRTELALKARVCLNNIWKMPAWEGNTNLKDTAIILFDFYCNVFEVRYKKLVDYYFTEPYTENEAAEIDKIDNSIIAEEDKLADNLVAAQENFGKLFGFVLEE